MGKLISLTVLLVGVALYMLVFNDSKFDPEAVRNQRILVTGASSGIGEQLAYQYAKLGAKLVITARNKTSLQNIAKKCEQLGGQQVHFVIADMAEPQDRIRLVNFVEKKLGGLDELLLNHAMQSNFWWTGSAKNFTTLHQIFRINFFASVDLATKTLPMLIASRGRIGVVASILAIFGTARNNAYGASKFALRGFFSSLRQELRHKNTGVSVTIAVLGPIATETLFSYVNQGYDHLPLQLTPSAEDAATVIIENVAQRSYSFVFDNKQQFGILINSFFPEFYEKFFADVMHNKGESWFSRLFLFVLQKLFV